MVELLNEAEAASRLTMRPATLRVWRCEGRGPAFVKVGRLVRYEPAEIEAFLAAGRRTPRSMVKPQ